MRLQASACRRFVLSLFLMAFLASGSRGESPGRADPPPAKSKPASKLVRDVPGQTIIRSKLAPKISPVQRDLRAVLADESMRLAKLRGRLAQATSAAEAAPIHLEMARVKRAAWLRIVDIQIVHSRSMEQRAALERLRGFLLRKTSAAARIHRTMEPR